MDSARLGRAAVRYAEQGWPVAPGSWWGGHRWLCDVNDCDAAGLHPAIGSHVRVEVAASATSDPTQAQGWWARAPFTILCPTGVACDVVELAAGLSTRHILGTGAPIAAGMGRAWLFAAPGPETGCTIPRVTVHQRGSWVALPPSALTDRIHWVVDPVRVGWVLPGLHDVLTAVSEASDGRRMLRLGRGRRRLR